MKKMLCALLPFLLIGCGKTLHDYGGTSTWEFKNESTHAIEVMGYLGFRLAKDATHSFDFNVGTGKYVSEDSFRSPYDAERTKITLDGERVVTVPEIADIKNYTSEKITDRHYKFTYTFTDADFPEE